MEDHPEDVTENTNKEDEEGYDENVVEKLSTDKEKLKYLVSCYFSEEQLKNCSRTGKRSIHIGSTARPPLNGNDFRKLTTAVGKHTSYVIPTF